jgi:hypothetical protein
MTPEQFVYWLQGCLEITDPKNLGEKEIQIIKDHIALVLKKETPTRLSSPLLDQPVVRPPIFGPSTSYCMICQKDHGGLPCPNLTVVC